MLLSIHLLVISSNCGLPTATRTAYSKWRHTYPCRACLYQATLTESPPRSVPYYREYPFGKYRLVRLWHRYQDIFRLQGSIRPILHFEIDSAALQHLKRVPLTFRDMDAVGFLLWIEIERIRQFFPIVVKQHTNRSSQHDVCFGSLPMTVNGQSVSRALSNRCPLASDESCRLYSCGDGRSPSPAPLFCPVNRHLNQHNSHSFLRSSTGISSYTVPLKSAAGSRRCPIPSPDRAG